MISAPLETSTGPACGASPAPRAAAPTRRRLPMLLRRAWFGLNQAFRHHAAPFGVTPDQYTVLRTLAEAKSGRLTQGGLARTMSSDANTIASLLRRMEEQGLLKRETHPRDARARRLVLSRQGRQTYRRVRRVALALQESVLSVLAEEGRELFLEQLETVAGACWREALVSRPRAESTRGNGSEQANHRRGATPAQSALAADLAGASGKRGQGV